MEGARWWLEESECVYLPNMRSGHTIRDELSSCFNMLEAVRNVISTPKY